MQGIYQDILTLIKQLCSKLIILLPSRVVRAMPRPIDELILKSSHMRLKSKGTNIAPGCDETAIIHSFIPFYTTNKKMKE